MNKNLKKWTEFTSESLNTRPVLQDRILQEYLNKSDSGFFRNVRDDFADYIIDMVEFFPGYYSDMCKKKDANPENDFNEMQSLLGKKGFTIDSIQNLFKPEVNQLCGQDFFQWLDSRRLDSQNGHCDTYLYFIAKHLGLDYKKIELGGPGWSDYQDEGEILIRYKYGYHQTKYGKMMLDQIGMTVEEFRSKALKSLIEDFSTDFSLCVYRATKKDNPGIKIDSRLFSGDDFNLDKFSIVEEDRFIIFYNEIIEYVKKELGFVISSETIISEISKDLKWTELEVNNVEGNLIIYHNFSE